MFVFLKVDRPFDTQTKERENRNQQLLFVNIYCFKNLSSPKISLNRNEKYIH